MFEIRPAKKNDAILIHRYIKELAVAESFPFDITVTLHDIEKNLLGPQATARAVICYHQNKPCGFAVFYFSFSTATGRKGLHIDDVYIEPAFQRKGYGKQVFSWLAKEAQKHQCARMEWWALKTNDPAIRFYRRMGARKLDEIAVFRLNSEEIERLSTEKNRHNDGKRF